MNLTPEQEAAFAAFSESIFAKVKLLKRPTLPAKYRARIRESISDDLKKVSNLVTPEASRAALDAAVPLDVDLFRMTWHDQHQFDEGRKEFLLEHVRPVSALRDRCVAAGTLEGVFEVLKSELRVAWILKDEDDELTRLGYRSKRPDPDAAYRHAKIEVVRQPTASAGTEGDS